MSVMVCHYYVAHDYMYSLFLFVGSLFCRFMSRMCSMRSLFMAHVDIVTHLSACCKDDLCSTQLMFKQVD